MEYYQIIIYMLALSEFFKNNIGSDRKDTFLLLEPIIIDILKSSPLSYEYIIQELNKLKLLNEENIITILGSFKSMKIIEHNQDNDSYCLAKNMEYIKNRNEKLIENKSASRTAGGLCLWEKFRQRAWCVLAEIRPPHRPGCPSAHKGGA